MTNSAVDNARALLRSVLTTREEEIACGDCFAALDEFLELVLEGEQADELMPLVQNHLKRCRDCREEFDALLAALRATT